MRLYFDTCSLQRPLDERSQTRIVLEAEAILAILALCEQGHIDLVVSDMVVYESSNNPHPQKRQFVMEVINQAKDHVSLSSAIEQRATTFEQGGIKDTVGELTVVGKQALWQGCDSAYVGNEPMKTFI